MNTKIKIDSRTYNIASKNEAIVALEKSLADRNLGFHPGTGEVVEIEDIPHPSMVGPNFESWLLKNQVAVLVLKDSSEVEVYFTNQNLYDTCNPLEIGNYRLSEVERDSWEEEALWHPRFKYYLARKAGVYVDDINDVLL